MRARELDVAPRVAPGARSLVDAVGAALLLAALIWTLVASAASDGSSGWAGAGLLTVSAGALAIGRATGSVRRWVVPAIVAVAAGVALLSPGALDREPLHGPFGYSNAAGAFFALAAVAALMVGWASQDARLRGASAAVAVAYALVPLVRGSVAPAVLVLLAPAALVLARRPHGIRLVVAGCSALFAAALVATLVVGAMARSGEPATAVPGVLESALSSRRIELWGDAVAIMAAHPALGVGPGRFAEVSDVARRDVDARWAHNEFLQRGAEEGIVGLVLLAGLVAWGFVRLWVAESPDVVTALGAVALAIAAIHACVDYVWHFPAIPIAAAALVGVAQAAGSRAPAPGEGAR
jgi:O-antigen ligase